MELISALNQSNPLHSGHLYSIEEINLNSFLQSMHVKMRGLLIR